MKKIIYFTSAQDQKTFENEINNFSISPNLSNQNFHNKLIRCLSISHAVDVISVRPINKTYKFSEMKKDFVSENNISWNYVSINKSRINKLITLKGKIENVIKERNAIDSIVFVDVLNLSLVKNAINIAKQYKLKVIGIVTDNPDNISFVNSAYNKSLMRKITHLDGYICLSEKLNSLVNVNNKPYVVFDGLTEDISYNPPIIKDKYIYFGGSLMHEYGLFELIEAFRLLKLNDVKLVITGHHEPSDLKNFIKNDENIVYLGPISYKDNVTLSHFALCSVNPRPIKPEIDDYSFPSKVLEYVASGSITVSTSSPYIYKSYGNSIIWSISSNPSDLSNAIKKALSLSENQKAEFILNSKTDVAKKTSFPVINNLIDQTLF